MLKYLSVIAILFVSQTVFAQQEVAIQCDNCSSTSKSTAARIKAQQNNLYTNDVVNVLDLKNRQISSFKVNRTINRRNGNAVHLVLATPTNPNVSNDFLTFMSKIDQISQTTSTSDPDINITTVTNPCRQGPGGMNVMATSVWDFVGCPQAVNLFNQRVPDYTSIRQDMALVTSNFASNFTSPVNFTVVSSIELFTSDNGVLFFNLEYNVLSGDEITIKAELDLEKSFDYNGNPLTITNSSDSNGSDNGHRYFPVTNGDDGQIRGAAIEAFVDAANRMGLTVNELGEGAGSLFTKCTRQQNGDFICST